MKFYEIHEPYYALIKAKDEIDATQKYIEIVAGSDKEFEEIREEMNIVEKDYVTRILAHSTKYMTKDNDDERLRGKKSYFTSSRKYFYDFFGKGDISAYSF